MITSGIPPIEGDSILDRRRFAREHLDHFRKILMWEPRGHADMYGCILMPPATPDGDVGVLFLHNEGYSTMCGHGIIGLVKVGLDCGLFEPADATDIKIDTPAGRVLATAHIEDGAVARVSFKNVASFVLHPEITVEVDSFGAVICNIAYGGAFYAYVDAGSVGVALEPQNTPTIIDLAMQIKRAVSEQVEIVHPAGDPDLNFLYGTILVGPSARGHHSRNVCVFAEGEVDRSPTGTGVSGRAAIHYARGEIKRDETITIESIVGSTFDVSVADTCTVGDVRAVIPEVTGTAFITGMNEFVVDPEDSLGNGFFLRDRGIEG